MKPDPPTDLSEWGIFCFVLPSPSQQWEGELLGYLSGVDSETLCTQKTKFEGVNPVQLIKFLSSYLLCADIGVHYGGGYRGRPCEAENEGEVF